MKRTLVALSTLLCLAACTMWVRSHLVADLWRWADAAGKTVRLSTVRSSAGEVTLVDSNLELAEPAPGITTGVVHTTDDADGALVFDLIRASSPRSMWERLGFAYSVHQSRDGSSTRVVNAPYWSVAAATALLPAIGLLGFLRRRRAARRRLANRCAECGYDLRASPDRCPECGAMRDKADRRST
ncbi:MAG TPA: hypothetical protein VEA69_05045 [Tepidisphaeraceae bacterium]|nr:hypothetical protein [Tepidisphaeraceae bacterium]